MTQKKACVLGGLPGAAVLFFSPPSWRMTGDFHLDQCAKIAEVVLERHWSSSVSVINISHEPSCFESLLSLFIGCYLLLLH